MKRLSLSSIFIFLSFFAAVTQQNVKDGTITGSTLPNKDAILELESVNRGLLHARVE